MADNHAAFVGSIPDNYDRCLGPLFFRPHAAAMARFLPALKQGRILELACGTGILTRVLRDELPVGVEIIATDLNEAMIDHAREKFDASDRVVMLPADATTLPFPSNSFDAVFCQFGVMFFPDKPAAFAECLRVLVPGGTLAFNVWGPIGGNEPASIARDCVQRHFPANPPTFYETPFGFHDRHVIEGLLSDAGFEHITLDDAEAEGACASPQDAALGLIDGNPISREIEARDPAAVAVIRDDVTSRIAERFGAGAFRARTHAVICSACKPHEGSTP